MAVKSIDILEQLTQVILGAINFDVNIAKWEVENGNLTRTYFSDRKRDHSEAPFNRIAIERICSLYRSQFGIYKMREPISDNVSCDYANSVLEYVELLTGQDLKMLYNSAADPDESLNKRAYVLEILNKVLNSIEDKEYFEMSVSVEQDIHNIVDNYRRRAGTSGYLTEGQQRNFLVEAKGRCVRCDTKVILETDFSVVESYEFLFIEKAQKTDRSNVIVLCKNCYELLKNGMPDEEKKHLREKKYQLEVDAKYQDDIDDLKLEEEIEDVIQSLISVKQGDLIELNYEPKEVLEKIPDDFLLSDDVKRNVVKFFKYCYS